MKKGESELWPNNSRSMFSHRYYLTFFYLFEFEQNVRSCAGCNIQNIQLGDKTKGDFSLESFLRKIDKDEKISKTSTGYRCSPG